MTGAPKAPCDPDTALMVAFQQGEEAAFEQILDKYHKAIVNFIYKIVKTRSEGQHRSEFKRSLIRTAGRRLDPSLDQGLALFDRFASVVLRKVCC